MYKLPTCADLVVTADPLCFSAVGAAVEQFAQRADLELGPRAALVAASEEACRSTLKLLQREQTPLKVRIEGYEDRIEIRIEHQGPPEPSVGLDTFALLAQGEAGCNDVTGLVLMSLVDRVTYETSEGVQRTTLVKYVQPAGKEP